jgi:osmotically-inducible protein OsmY
MEEPMKHGKPLVALVLGLAIAAGCGGGEEPAPEETPQGENVMSVPDSTIEREIRNRLDADPRLDSEGIDLRVASDAGIVSLIGEVPSRMEMSIAREVVLSAPGVVDVNLDSLVVLSEQQNASAAADTSGVD